MGVSEKISGISAYAVFVVSGFLLVFFCLTGRDLAAWGNIMWTASYTAGTLAVSAGAGGLLGAALCFLFRRAAAGAPFPKMTLRLFRRVSGSRAPAVFAVSFLSVLICRLPGYLAYYPGICAYDMPIQTGQIADGRFNDHHPIFHTLLIKWMMELGRRLFGSVNAGIGLYTLLQTVFLAAAFACAVTYLWRRRARLIWLLLLQLFCMIYPFHLYMSVSVTKDSIFCGFFVLQITALFRLLECGEEERPHLGAEAGFFAASVGMILFRTNGKYAFLVFLVFAAAAFLFGRGRRRFYGRLLLWSIGAFLAGNLALTAVFRVTGAEQGDRREMLSMPIQQLARVMVYHGGIGVVPEDDGTLDETSKALINDFILNEGYRKYRPDFADPVKSNTNTYVVRYRAKDFLTTYFTLLKKYPGDFINAALAVDAGYLYPGDETHAFVNAQADQAAGGGYVQTRWDEATLNDRGIYKASKWPALYRILEKWADGNAYLDLPVLKYLFVPGIWLYLYLLLFGALVIGKRFRLCLPLTLVLGYYLTLLLGPTVQLRYIYPIMTVLPFAACQSFLKKVGCDDAGIQRSVGGDLSSADDI